MADGIFSDFELQLEFKLGAAGNSGAGQSAPVAVGLIGLAVAALRRRRRA